MYRIGKVLFLRKYPKKKIAFLNKFMFTHLFNIQLLCADGNY